MASKKLLSLVDLLQKSHITIPLKDAPLEEKQGFSRWVAKSIGDIIERQGGFFRAGELAALQHYERTTLQRAEPHFNQLYFERNSFLTEKRQRLSLREKRIDAILHTLFGLQTVTRYEPWILRQYHIWYQETDKLRHYIEKLLTIVHQDKQTIVGVCSPYKEMLENHQSPFTMPVKGYWPNKV